MFYDISKELFLPYVLLFFIIFGFGIVIGSFLNVCIIRLPQSESLIKKSSHCMKCGGKIKFYDLIPIFSWIFLKGRCRSCGEKISGRYPIVELLNGIMLVLAFIRFDFTPKAILHALFLSALIIVAFMDWDTEEINLGVLIFIGILSIPAFFLTDDISLKERLIGAIVISIPFLIINFITKGIGNGDTILMAAGGLFLGYKAVLTAAFIGIVIAGIMGIIIKKRTKKSKFAFGPWLSIGLAVSAFYGTNIFNWYIGFLK